MKTKLTTKKTNESVGTLELTRQLVVYLYKRRQKKKQIPQTKGLAWFFEIVQNYLRSVSYSTWTKLSIYLGLIVAVVAFSWKLKQKLLAIHRNVTLNKMNTKLLDDIDSPLCSLDQWNEFQRKLHTEDADVYDVCIVGAGPSGSTCAFYLAKGGKKVLLLEKQKFPRDKVCGNTINTTAQYHLKDMGVLQEILSEFGSSKWAYTGGLVSPSGDSFVGEFTSSRVINIPRNILDHKVATAAARQGAHFRDQSLVESVEFISEKGIWHITVIPQSDSEQTQKNTQQTQKILYKARVLVAADGAESGVGRSLGRVGTAPDAVGGSCLTKGRSHPLRACHVRFYPKELLPGHVLMANEANGALNLCCFALQGGKVTAEELPHVFHELLRKDPLISKSIGSKTLLEEFKVAPLRVKTVPKIYGDNFIIIGEAAGQVDPFTGEGIQYGMDAGKIAAQNLLEALYIDDLSEQRLKFYQDQCSQKFAWDFFFSSKLTQIIHTYPIILDALVAVVRRRGADFVTSWALVSTGVKSKLWLARPDVGWMIGLEVLIIRLSRLFKSVIY